MLGLRLPFGDHSGRGWSRQLARTSEGEGGETLVTVGADMLAPEVFDERVVTGVLGHDMKTAGGLRGHGAADVVGEREVEGVLAAGSKAHQLHRGGVLQELFDQGHIELCLPRAQQQREADGFAADDRMVDFMDILKINEDVIYRGREIGITRRHTIILRRI